MKDRERREFADKHPEPSDAREALAHVLDLFSELPDDQLMIQATSGVYGPGVRTGLTMGDLRELAGLLPEPAAAAIDRKLKEAAQAVNEMYPDRGGDDA
ncbi:hypothetical protein [Streptomyces sp. OK228]|uniref:hypothetical protein n=1 Tax=Streptomyces sp. OK228 TaxID=1882786 RepID=UPI000BD3391A|nr:hypothetical protein [Streptomyces sp. OK228]SOE25699.1 hypothetical protein SAMN05442782_2444 [Streptomyces sp. OK228]